MSQIITMGGGGFGMEPDNLALDRYIIQQAGVANPRVCFLPQASGESLEYVVNFYRAYNQLGCRATHLSLFSPPTADLESFLMEQDVIHVGGGNTKSMLALWREWGVDAILRKALAAGRILSGMSAGCICWFEYGLTDSIPGPLTALPCLGILKGSATPHYDGEANRRPTYQARIGGGEMPDGVAFDDGAAGHYRDGQLVEVVSSRPQAKGYRIQRTANGVEETVLPTRYLLEN